MARLLIKSTGFDQQSLELHLGLNTFGRSPDNDWQINHPTISSRHCEIEIELAGVRLRDCGSTNGTFLNDQPVKEAKLAQGQSLRLGDVELVVENVDVKIAIPRFEVPIAAPPVVTSSGGMVCPNHPDATVTHRCSHCAIVMCEACVRHMRRRGGKVLMLCPVCSHPVDALGEASKKKKGFMDYLRTTVKMPFVRSNNKKR